MNLFTTWLSLCTVWPKERLEVVLMSVLLSLALRSTLVFHPRSSNPFSLIQTQVFDSHHITSHHITSHITHHTSHITHHTSHITHHTSHITHHTSHHITSHHITSHSSSFLLLLSITRLFIQSHVATSNKHTESVGSSPRSFHRHRSLLRSSTPIKGPLQVCLLLSSFLTDLCDLITINNNTTQPQTQTQTQKERQDTQFGNQHGKRTIGGGNSDQVRSNTVRQHDPSGNDNSARSSHHKDL